MSARRAVLAAMAAVACGSPPRRTPPPLADQIGTGARDQGVQAREELRAEILDAYQRDEPPELNVALLPETGPARIGAGPGDFLVDRELDNAGSRWPLTLDTETPSEARSKVLQLHAAADGSAAWMFDEVSWRITVCQHVLVIPLRVTALYARDGDRWVYANEHVSWGAPATLADPVLGRNVPSVSPSSELASALAAAIAPLLANPIPASASYATTSEAVLIGPTWGQEWHGADITGQALAAGPLAVEDARAGVIGRDEARASVAYWVGNLRSTQRPQARLRATFVLERRAGQWVVVQGHVSAPIDDDHLAAMTLGSAKEQLNPLRAKCE